MNSVAHSYGVDNTPTGSVYIRVIESQMNILLVIIKVGCTQP